MPTECTGPSARMDKTIVRTVRLQEQGNDFAFRQTRSYEERVAALEEMRREYFDGLMDRSRDFNEFIESVNTGRAWDLVVGGYAVALHGYPRLTRDLDVWIEPTAANARRVLHALESLAWAASE